MVDPSFLGALDPAGSTIGSVDGDLQAHHRHAIAAPAAITVTVAAGVRSRVVLASAVTAHQIDDAHNSLE